MKNKLPYSRKLIFKLFQEGKTPKEIIKQGYRQHLVYQDKGAFNNSKLPTYTDKEFFNELEKLAYYASPYMEANQLRKTLMLTKVFE